MSATPDTHVPRTVRNRQENHQGNRQQDAREPSTELVALDIPASVGISPTVAPDRFNEFWTAYPRKAAKAAGRKAWTTALRRTDAQTIIDGAHRYADDPNRDPAFTKHPATWLNGDCWDDDPLPARGGRPVDRQAELLRSEMEKAIAADNAREARRHQIGA